MFDSVARINFYLVIKEIQIPWCQNNHNLLIKNEALLRIISLSQKFKRPSVPKQTYACTLTNTVFVYNPNRTG